jgi:PAS domain S-box-containing protein
VAALFLLLAVTAVAAFRYRRSARLTAARVAVLEAGLAVGVTFLDNGGRYVSINPPMAEINGVPAADHLGRHPQAILPPTIAEQVMAIQAQIRQTGEGSLNIPYTGPLIGREHEGERHLLMSFVPVSVHGILAGMYGLVYDATAQRRVEAVIRQEGEEFRLLAETLTVMVWRLTLPDGIRYANPAAVAYTGFAADDANDGRWKAMVHPGDLEMLFGRWRQVSATGDNLVVDTRLKRASDGMYRWHRLHASPIRRAEGRVTEWLATGTDIEDHKQAIQVRETFLSVASHELKTPISALMLQLHVLKRRLGDADPALAQRLAVASRHGERLTQLVNNLLDVSRIISGRFDDPQSMALREVVDEVADRFVLELEETGLAVVDDGPGPLIGQWDRLHIDQILTNLLTNALKYGEGSRITIRLSRDGDDACLAVGDGGPGIAAADLDRVFLQYHRSTASDGPPGHGLGLWIVQHLTERMGGRVSVRSQPGAGATFIVRLPLAAA